MKPYRSMVSISSSTQVAGPPSRTPANIGPMTSQTSGQASRAGAAQALGCLLSPSIVR